MGNFDVHLGGYFRVFFIMTYVGLKNRINLIANIDDFYIYVLS
jgi:hypothetical protein